MHSPPRSLRVHSGNLMHSAGIKALVEAEALHHLTQLRTLDLGCALAMARPAEIGGDAVSSRSLGAMLRASS